METGFPCKKGRRNPREKELSWPKAASPLNSNHNPPPHTHFPILPFAVFFISFMNAIINIYFMYCILSEIAAVSVSQNGNCSSSLTSKPLCFGAYTWITQLMITQQCKAVLVKQVMLWLWGKIFSFIFFSNWWIFLSLISLILSSASSIL